MTAFPLVRRSAAALATAAAFLFAGSGVALADGSPTIATATPVVLGQLELGNTLNGDLTTDGLDGYDSWWALNVVNGDNVTVNWQAPLDVYGQGPVLSVFEVGTTAATDSSDNALQSDSLDANGTHASTFTADMTGVMPLQFESGECCIESAPGPYEFTVTVTHAVGLALPAVTSIAPKGTLNVGVGNPDGAPISDPALVVELQVEAAGQPWTTIGTSSPSAGTADIAYSVPASLKGKTVKLQAVAHGAGYQTQTSGSQSVTVSQSGSGAGAGTGNRTGGTQSSPHAAYACVVPNLVGKKLRFAKKALKAAGCHLGHVRHSHGSHSKHGRVLGQSLTAGKRLRVGTKVNLVVGR